MMTNSIIL